MNVEANENGECLMAGFNEETLGARVFDACVFILGIIVLTDIYYWRNRVSISNSDSSLPIERDIANGAEKVNAGEKVDKITEKYIDSDKDSMTTTHFELSPANRNQKQSSFAHYYAVKEGDFHRLVPHSPESLPPEGTSLLIRLEQAIPALITIRDSISVEYARIIGGSIFFITAILLKFTLSNAVWLMRLSSFLGLVCIGLPHLLKSSPYRSDPKLRCRLAHRDVHRTLSDKLVWTSLIYAVPALYGFAVRQYGIAVLQTVTTIGSTLFHLSRETRYFNLDNIGAMSLLFSTFWSLILALYHGVWYHALVISAGTPFAVFFMVSCGMPGIICCCPSGDGSLRRASNPLYDHYHMLWHITSGFGTIASIHFFELNFPHIEAGGGYFPLLPEIPIVPVACFFISCAVNVYGNTIGILPLS